MPLNLSNSTFSLIFFSKSLTEFKFINDIELKILLEWVVSKNGNSVFFKRKIGFAKELSNSINFSESLTLSWLLSGDIEIISFSLRFKLSFPSL